MPEKTGFTIHTHDHTERPVVISSEALHANISLHDLGLYAKVSLMLDILNDDLDSVVNELAYGDRYEETEIRDGIQRLGAAGLLHIEPGPAAVAGLPDPRSAMLWSVPRTGIEPDPVRYALVTVRGELRFGDAGPSAVRELISENGHGETGMEAVSDYDSLAAYYFEPFERPDARRMNKVANGMYFDLAAPGRYGPPQGDESDEPPEGRPDRVLKMRGPVVFIQRSRTGLTADQEDSVRDAHAKTFGFLRGKGWI